MKNLGSIGNSGRLSTDQENEDGEISRLAISTLQAREEEIERKKMEVKKRVELQLGRAEQETKRLAQIWELLTESERQKMKKLKELSKNIKYIAVHETEVYSAVVGPKGLAL